MLQTVANLARKAGAIAMRSYKGEYGTALKKDKSVVTQVDHEIHSFLIEGLGKCRVPILSEEGEHDAAAQLAEGEVFVVDPLDGTADFIQETDDFCIMIALVEKGEPVMGVVYAPAHGKLYGAARNKGAWVEEGEGEMAVAKRMKVSNTSDPARARLLSSRNHFSETSNIVQQALQLTEVRAVGSNGLKLGMIAEGEADLYVNPSKKLGWWDIAAPQVILEEAGGKVTGMRGEAIRYHGPGIVNPHGLVATNGLLHEAAVRAASTMDGAPQ